MSGGATTRERTRGVRRDLLLDTAGDLMRTRGWGRTRMVDVAAAARISRTTLYTEFSNRDEIAQAALLREITLLLVPFEVGLAKHPEDAQLALAVAFDDFLVAVLTNPLAQALVLNEDNEEILELLTIRGGPAIELILTSLAGFVEKTWPGVDPAAADLLADGLGRLGVSAATLPGRDPVLTGARVAELFGPYARAVTGTPTR